jgi:A/G-specific adenine glycosylase
MAAQDYVSSLDVNGIHMSNAKLISNFSPLVHVFTHLKLTMHAFRFRITVDRAEDVDLVRTGVPARKWVDAASMDGETLSTGMRKCWDQERLTGSV